MKTTTLTVNEIYPAGDFATVKTAKQLRGMVSLLSKALSQDGHTNLGTDFASRARAIPDSVSKDEINAILLSVGWRLQKLGYQF